MDTTGGKSLCISRERNMSERKLGMKKKNKKNNAFKWGTEESCEVRQSVFLSFRKHSAVSQCDRTVNVIDRLNKSARQTA